MENNNKETIKEEIKTEEKPEETLEAETEEETVSEEESDEAAMVRSQVFGIEVRMQEIDAILERYEDDFYKKQQNQPEETEVPEVSGTEDEKIIALKAEYKELAKTRRELLKGNKKSLWDNFPVWMGFYAVFQIIFSFYLILTQFSTYFATWFYQLFTNPTNFWFYFGLFLIPFVSLLASLIITLVTKNKLHRKIFLFVYLIQGIETLISVGMLIYAIAA